MRINYFLLNILKHYLWALSKSDILGGYGYEMVMSQWDLTESVRFQVSECVGSLEKLPNVTYSESLNL